MTTLLAIGVACGLTALIMSLFMRDRLRIQQSGAMFVAILAMFLAQYFPAWGNVLGIVAIVAAVAYAVLAFRSMRGKTGNNSD